jgi:3-deoxy-D-manno-octulosonate 8-phosphate phosphatase (KDO 8-P phosphatase)
MAILPAPPPYPSLTPLFQWEPGHIKPYTWSGIRLLGLDVDGVMTQGEIIYQSDGGETSRTFNVKDGQGIVSLMKAGVEVAIVTAGDNPCTTQRATTLKIHHLFQAVTDKWACFNAVRESLGIPWEACAYMGDDKPDIPVIRACVEAGGVGACPVDAVPEVQQAVNWRSQFAGGRGAIRELTSLILQHKTQT